LYITTAGHFCLLAIDGRMLAAGRLMLVKLLCYVVKVIRFSPCHLADCHLVATLAIQRAQRGNRSPTVDDFRRQLLPWQHIPMMQRSAHTQIA